MKVLWLHGKESDPLGSKYRALAAAGFDVIAPDFRGLELEARVAIAAPLVTEHRPLVVGSSLGGITALLAVREAGGPIPGVVLCAPALRYPHRGAAEPLESLGVPCPVTIVHGIEDDVTPIEPSRDYARLHGAKLVEVHDGHRLLANIGAIVDAVRELTGASPPG